MTTNYIAPAAASGTANTTRSSALSAEDRQKLADLAAEFESLLLNNMLRDMRVSGKWSGMGETSLDTLGADTFDHTFDLELSRYLAKAGGLGLSQQLLKALDAVAGENNSRVSSSSSASTSDISTSDIWKDVNTFTTGAVYAGRTGWNGLRLDAPPSGGSGALWAGFNNDRAMAGGDDKSIKDAFFRWTYGLEFNPAGKSKEEIGEYLKNHLASAREYGLNILDVKGEQILVETAESGPEWIDTVASAGSTNPGEVKWQWLAQSEFGAPIGGGALGAALMDLRSASGGSERARAVLIDGRSSGDALLSALRAETAAARSGAPSPAQQRNAASTVNSTEGLSLPAGQVTSAYGWRQDPFTGQTSFHRGVDVRAAEGTEVKSVGTGKVTFSGTTGGYGINVIVEHTNGLSTLYAHLSEALAHLGDEVSDGQLIGRAGQTGRATAAHLHFEVLENGVPVDPQR